jgi:hypothetical protein
MMPIRRYLGWLVATGLAGALAYSQEAATNETAPAAPAAAAAVAEKPVDEKDVRSKLLPLTDMETAFKKTLARRDALARQVGDLEKKLKDTADEEQKKEIRKTIGDARKGLQTLAEAMEVVFGIGRTRSYEYDEVKSTIYLRVGTAEEVFVRAIKTRDAYAKMVVDQKAALEQEADAGKKKELAKSIEELSKGYTIMAMALQQVYGVTPSREFSYNPNNSTLYLKVSENEMTQLKEQIEKLQEERKAGEAAAGAAAPVAEK